MQIAVLQLSSTCNCNVLLSSVSSVSSVGSCISVVYSYHCCN